MPKNNETTTKFKVDISELKKGIQDAQRQIRLANAEFKAASSGMDDWSKSADGISAKLKQLNTTVDAQKKVLSSLEQQYAEVVKEQGETSKGAEELKIKIANQQAAINKTEKEISKYEKALAEVDDESGDVSKSSDKAAKGIKEIADEAKDGEKNTKSFADSLANLAKKGFATLATAAAGATTAFLASGSATREYREDMAKLEAAFESSGHSAETAKDTYKDFYKVLGEEDRSVEAVNHLAQLTDNEEELAKWTDICAGVTATFGDSLPIEGLTEAANETAKVSKVTGPLADALNWAGISEDEFNEKLAACATEQERATLITNTLNDTYDKAADKYKELNKDVMASRDAQSELNDKMAEVGKKAEPIMTAIKKGFADILSAVLDLTKNVDFSAVADAISDGFGYFIDKIIPAVVKGFNFIIDNSDIIIAAIAGIGAAFVALKVVTVVQKITTAIKAWTVATEGMTVAQKLLNLAMAANPIGIVIALITGLVAAFVVLWNKSEAFREFWINLWNKVKEITSAVVTAIGEFFSNLWDKITNIFKNIGGWFSDKFNQIHNSAKKIIENVKNFFKNGYEFITNIFENIGGWFGEKFDQAVKNIKNAFSSVGSFFSDIWSSIKNAFGSVTSWFSDTFSNAWQAVKNVFSTGGKIFDGIKEGIASTFTTVVNAIISGINKVIAVPFNSINGVLNKIRSVKIPVINVKPFSGLWSENPLPVPQIPQLYDGTVVKKGKPYLLEGRGDEAVVPLHNNKKWISKVAQDMKNELYGAGSSGGNTSTINNYNFNQTNNSPKALSRLEIYRQTKNQLQFAKGV